MSKHASSMLEDMIVASADAASAIYLGRSSVMGGREENDWPILVRPSIKSTRALERFRNEVGFTTLVSQFMWSMNTMCLPCCDGEAPLHW